MAPCKACAAHAAPQGPEDEQENKSPRRLKDPGFQEAILMSVVFFLMEVG